MSSGKSTLTPYVSSYLNTQNDVPPTSQQSNRLRYPVILPKSAPSGTYTQQHIQNTGPTPTPAIGVPGNKNQYYSVKPGSFPGESVMTPTNKLGTTKTSRNPQPTQNVHDIRPEVHHFCASSEISDTMLPATRENLDITQAPYVKGTVWNEQPFYLLLTKTSIPAGGKTQYEEPAPTGFGGVNDFTSFVYGQAGMTKDFLPTYMYMLEPPDEFKAYCEWRKKNTKAKVDHMGVTMYERWPAEGTAARPLLDIAGLPDQISTREEWWRLEAWRRLTGCKWHDILMRMMPEGGLRQDEVDRKKRNSLNMMGSRTYYPHFRMLSWFITSSNNGSERQQLLEWLSDWHRDHNSTRGLTPGLVNPSLGESLKNRVKVPPLSSRCGRRLPGGRKRKTLSSQADEEDQDLSSRRKRAKLVSKKPIRQTKAPQTSANLKGAKPSSSDRAECSTHGRSVYRDDPRSFAPRPESTLNTSPEEEPPTSRYDNHPLQNILRGQNTSFPNLSAGSVNHSNYTHPTARHGPNTHFPSPSLEDLMHGNHTRQKVPHGQMKHFPHLNAGNVRHHNHAREATLASPNFGAENDDYSNASFEAARHSQPTIISKSNAGNNYYRDDLPRNALQGHNTSFQNWNAPIDDVNGDSFSSYLNDDASFQSDPDFTPWDSSS